MMVSTLFRHLVAVIMVSSVIGENCGWLFSDIACDVNKCCSVDGFCGVGPKCAIYSCQSGNCDVNPSPPVGAFDFCSSIPNPKKTMANLELSASSPDRPTIDGKINYSAAGLFDWTGDEYANFTKLEMYIAGNPTKPWVGTSYIAFDCDNHIFCVAAHLNSNYTMDAVERNPSSAWVRFGEASGNQKLFFPVNPSVTNVSATTFVLKPDDPEKAIGYEGCWDLSLYSDLLGRIAPVVNDIVTIHFDKTEITTSKNDTVATGFNDDQICLRGDCTTSRPTMFPSTKQPSKLPSNSPTETPTKSPSDYPTETPTKPPSVSPTVARTSNPSVSPSVSPTTSPSHFPTETPTNPPSVSPTKRPTTDSPTETPTSSPSVSPSVSPTMSPSNSPTETPTNSPSLSPTKRPTTDSPTETPTKSPSVSPTVAPTNSPSVSPSVTPTTSPSNSPTETPTNNPSVSPTVTPTRSPSDSPTVEPTSSPSVSPSVSPTMSPSNTPTETPTNSPSVSPSVTPTTSPSNSPMATPTNAPSVSPSVSPTTSPSDSPMATPTKSPSISPTASLTTRAPIPDIGSETLTPTKAQCCPLDTGFCPSDDSHTFRIPMLNLLRGSFQRPAIDGKIDQDYDDIGDNIAGWNNSEYSLFVELPMFNGGKNGGNPLQQEGRIGTAYLAYDCNHQIVCITAHLDASFMINNPMVEVLDEDDESWIRFGPNEGETKLKESNADEFQYVGKPADDNSTIGYEGCWNSSTVGEKMQDVTNNYVEVHFSRSENGKRGETVSSGKPASDGAYTCLAPGCLVPLLSPSVSPSKVPTSSCTPRWNKCTQDFECCDKLKCTQVGSMEWRCLSDNCPSPTASPITSQTRSPNVITRTMPPSTTPTSSPSTAPIIASSNAPIQGLSTPPSTSPTSSPSSPLTCGCPNRVDVCLRDNHTFTIPLLDLSQSGIDKPNIDGKIDSYGDGIGDDTLGWNGTEYSTFLMLPMFNGGKNGVDPLQQKNRIGTAYIAYDCRNEIVCVAALLYRDYTIEVSEKDDESWIRFGLNEGETKLRASNADEFMYVNLPGRKFRIGYEGCWNNVQMQTVLNNYVEVHFNRRVQTVSTGKPAANGAYDCLIPYCETSTATTTQIRMLRGVDTEV